MNDDEKVVYFGETDARNKRIKFGIKNKDRSKHMYAIGKTGMGKSTLLENLAVQDILNGDGLAFIDPHGKSADLLLEYIPKERMKDVIYFAPFDMEFPISFNVMEDVGAERRYLVASGLMSAFKKVWVDAWSARMEYILGNVLLALLEYPGSTLISVNRMLTDKEFRKDVINNISDPSVKSFWVNEYANYTDKFAAEATPAIQNKVGQFVANPLIRNIIGQPKSTFDIRDIMDNKKILIVNLSKGRVGEANANLLGSMLITKIYLGAMSRADMKERELSKAPNFYMYVDEFQSFANESFADILSEARKYKLNLIIAHQYIEQMSEEVRAAVFGNVGTMCVFRVGATDAEYLEKEFAPAFTAEDLVNLQKYQMYLKLMIDGVASSPFSASGMAPIQRPEINLAKEIIDTSRAQYARPRTEVEDEIRTWHEKQFGRGGGGSPTAYGPQGGGSPSSRPPAPGANFGRSEGQNSPNRPLAPSGQAQPKAPTRPPQSTPSAGQFQRPQNVIQEGQSPRRDDSHSRPPSSRPMSQPPQPQQVRPPNSQFQSRTQTASGNFPPRRAFPEKTAENTIAANARENKLREAISLSYLKEPEPVEKNDDKAPKPENLAALRDVLLSVMASQPQGEPALVSVEQSVIKKPKEAPAAPILEKIKEPSHKPHKPTEHPSKSHKAEPHQHNSEQPKKAHQGSKNEEVSPELLEDLFSK